MSDYAKTWPPPLRDLPDWAAQHDGANGPDTYGTESVDGSDSGDSKDSDDDGTADMER